MNGLLVIFHARRPSRVDDMKAVVDRFWCRKNFMAITMFGHIFTRTQEAADRLNSRFDALKVHEMIHLRQAQSVHDSWLLFYVRYLWYSLRCIGYVRRMKGAMYYLNPFEIEAYRYMGEAGYLEKCRNGAVGWREFAAMPLKARAEYVRKYHLCEA